MQVKLDLTVGSLSQVGYLAKVYLTSTSMQFAWVADRHSHLRYQLNSYRTSVAHMFFIMVSYAWVDF